MDFTIGEIARIVTGKILTGITDTVVSKVVIDSRRVTDPKGAIFIALKGPTFDGHDYVRHCIEKGVTNFILSKIPESDLSKCNVILVENTLSALHLLAVSHRAKFTYPVLGITGSNGKTIIKEWINQTLYEDFDIVRSPKSYNSQVGVPLSILLMDDSKNLGVFEVGMSKPGEIERLAKIVKPDIGIFTNIGNAHSENFDSLEEKVREKAALFSSSKALIYCADDELIAKEMMGFSEAVQFNWSTNGNGLVNYSTQIEENNTLIKASYKKRLTSFSIPFTDSASIQNSLHLITFLIHFNIPNETIGEKLNELKKVGMRLETIEGINNSLLINDVYNSDLTSLEVALEMLAHEPNFKRKHLVLSEMKHTGLSQSQVIKNVGQMIKEVDLSSIHYVGQTANEVRPSFNETLTHYYNSTDEFLDSFDTGSFSDSAILIKGERKFEFERITHHLQKKTHDTVLEINLRALKENLNYYRSQLNQGVKMAVMVKAFSYGSGLHEIAAFLQKNNVDYLAVAYVDEGIALREKNIHLPIMVMNPENAAPSDFLQYDLEPVIYNDKLLMRFAENREINIPIHLKFDTGMHRLGFDITDVQSVIENIIGTSLNLRSVMTHLAASDDIIHDEFTKKQLSEFEKIKGIFSKKYGEGLDFHAINSAGISRFPDYHFDMVRLGIGLYGYSLNKEDQKFLQPVLSLKSVLSQIKTVKPGDSIGYSRSYIAKEPKTVGIVPIGYADGIHRSFGNEKGSVIINSKICKVIGNICMDMCMVDISQIQAEEGDEVEFFGEHKSIQDTSDEMGTIAYEVLASISQRVKRRFISD